MFKSLLNIPAKAYKSIKALMLTLWLQVPVGNVVSFKNGSTTVTLTKNLLVVISDGKSSDALPLAYVSESMVCRIMLAMHSKGYAIQLEELPQETLAQVRAALSQPVPVVS